MHISRNAYARTTLFILVLVIGCDLGYSYLHYADAPIDGDIHSEALPSESASHLLQDPFGIEVLRTGEGHSGTNRFFARYAMYLYYHHVPQWLQHFVDPIDSLYMASGLAKLFTHAFLWLVLLLLVSPLRERAWLPMAWVGMLITSLFQHSGYYHSMGIIDSAITYTFAYPLSMALLLLFLFPLVRWMFQPSFQLPVWTHFCLPPLAVVIAFNGPLSPAVLLVASATALIALLISTRSLRITWQTLLDRKQYTYHLIWAVLLCLYSMWLARYNTDNLVESIPLMERYLLLFKGLFVLVFSKLGYPIFLAFIILQMVLLRRTNPDKTSTYRKALLWIGLFTLLYVLLLPLGGYRDYRPLIIRRDTFLPILLLLMSVAGSLAFENFRPTRPALSIVHRSMIVLCSLVFFYVDISAFGRNDCEKAALETIASSDQHIVPLDSECTVLFWDRIKDPASTDDIGKALVLWNITDSTKQYYHTAP